MIRWNYLAAALIAAGSLALAPHTHPVRVALVKPSPSSVQAVPIPFTGSSGNTGSTVTWTVLPPTQCPQQTTAIYTLTPPNGWVVTYGTGYGVFTNNACSTMFNTSDSAGIAVPAPAR